MMRKLLVYSLLYFAASITRAQDIHFSQFYNTPLMLNPALTGAYSQYQGMLIYRDQWKSPALNPYRTFAGSFDMRITNKKWKNSYLGTGLFVFNDRAGVGKMGTTMGNLNLAGFTKVDAHNTMSGGLQFGFGQRSVLMSAFTWDNQFDGVNVNTSAGSGEGFGGSKFMNFDCAAGAAWNFNKSDKYSTANDALSAKLGLAVFHINRPRYTFIGTSGERQFMKFVLHSSTSIGIKNTKGTIIPTVLFLKQGPQNEITFGGVYKYLLVEDSKITGYVKSSYLYFGLHYRWRDALIASLHYDMGSFGFGISYDVNVSGLTPASSLRGGLEVSLRFHSLSSYMFAPSERF